jgi:integrase/recombinase XerC
MKNLEGFINYLKFEKRYSAHTQTAYKLDLQQFFDYLSTDYLIYKESEITDQMIRSWLAHLMDKGWSAKTVNRKISSVKSYFRYLLKQGVLEQNPSILIQGPKQKKRLPVFVEERKMDMLINKEIDHHDFTEVRNHLIMELFYSTGIRRAELIGLKFVDVDLIQNHIKVIGKRNKERIIPLGQYLIPTIKNYLQLREEHISDTNESEWFFLTIKGKKMYPKLVYRVVNSYLSSVSTQDKRSPHVLRHTFATHMLNHGADLNAVKELLGHASLAATQIYTHNTIDKLKKVYQQAHPKA